jgi:Ca2+-binding RTX toxin-like protein
MRSTPNSIRRASVDTLEERRLMAASIAFADGVLSITGDADLPNQVRVYTELRAGNLVALAGSTRRSFPLADVRSINIQGGSANDKLQLGENLKVPALISGLGGNDLLYGGAGADTLMGGTGNDKLVGRRGNDRLVGGGGQDIYVGGPGRNSYDRSQPQPDPIPDPVPTPGGDDSPFLSAPYPATVVERPVFLQHPNGGQLSLGRNVKLFRNADGTPVAGDGIQDDTTGIQKAIDSLPNSQGIPQGGQASGGTLYFPPGTYRITQPLQLPGGVILSGAGPASVLHYVGTTRSAVELIEDPEFPIDFCSGAGATNMTIRADFANGFGVNTPDRLHLTLLRFRDLVFDTAGWGINLLAGDSITQNSFFDNVLFRNVGLGAINIKGNANKLNALRVEGDVRPGAAPTPGVIVVQGSSTAMTNSVVSGAAADVAVPFYISGVSDGVSGGTLKFENNTVDAPDVAGPNGLPRFVISDVVGGSINDLGARKARFVRCGGLRLNRQWVDGTAADIARYLDADADTRILLDKVYSPVAAGAGNDPRAKVHVTTWQVGSFADYQAARGDVAALLPPAPDVAPTRVAIGVNAREFVCDDGVSVRADGVHDDATGLQKAIDLYLANRDNPGAPQSGAVYLPTGVYRITKPLVLPSGVVLLGDGSGTAIKYTGSGAAVRFNDPRGTVVAAGVESLCIGADNGTGIGDTAGVPVLDSRITDVALNCWGWGIDLRDFRDGKIFNVHQKKLAVGAVRVTGTRTLVHSVNTEFGTRPGFTFDADPAIVVVRGSYNTITGCVIEGVPSGSAHAYYASGTGVTFGNNWAEITTDGPLAAKGRVAFIFENLRDAHVQDLYLLNSNHRAQFINSQVIIDVLNTLGESKELKEYVVMDASSSLHLEFGITRWGLGTFTTGTLQTDQELVIWPGGDVTKFGTWMK